MKYILLIGRILYAGIFLMAITYHFKADAIGWAASKGVPLPNLLVPAAGILAFLGGLSIAVGYRARMGAWLLVIFLVPVTFWMHAFWNETDPMMMQMQMSNFMKNLSLLGSAFVIAWFGAGPMSLDELGMDDRGIPVTNINTNSAAA
jgi:putative oxidoreductase